MRSEDVVALAHRVWAALPDRRDEALAVLGGLFGDQLEAAGSSLAIETAFFRGHGDGSLSPVAGEDLGPRVCLLVHGLMGTERAWRLGSSLRGPVDYGTAIARERGATPLYVRYNTGRHISTNGRMLAQQLEALLEGTNLQELTIIAHSMGGLVTRSMCHYGMQAGHRWVKQLRRVALLGVPSHGASLEQLVHVAAFTLDAIWNPWTKLIGKVLNSRSAGIKDLRYGFVLDEDWMHRDPDELALRRPRVAQAPEGVRWFVAAGSVGDEQSALSRLLGDGLVHARSARGVGFGTPEPGLIQHSSQDVEVRVFGHMTHMALMRDPQVLEQLLSWWGERASPSCSREADASEKNL